MSTQAQTGARDGPARRRILVLGFGASGEAAARLLKREGAAVTVAEARGGEALERRAEALRAGGVIVRLGVGGLVAGGLLPRDRHSRANPDLCVVSPGVRADSAWVRALRRRGIPTVSELEAGALRFRCPCLAITGSKGKSTLAKLCAEALRRAGQRVALAGNYGPPACRVAPRTGRADWVVLEVSSFQLETVRDFHPRVAVLLNLSPDHLDRHRDMREYERLKFRIFRRMGRGDTRIVAGELRGRAPAGGRWVTFGARGRCDYRYRKGVVEFRDGAARREAPFAGTRFGNETLGPAAAAAVAAVRACGCDPGCVAEAAARFRPLPHRMQPVARARGVRFIDDSKATNLAALEAGVRMAGGRVRLIAGGLLKERRLSRVKQTLVKHVAKVYGIGTAAEAMRCAWSRVVPFSVCGDLAGAVRMASSEAVPGDVVLLSPGCASFDQFDGYADRGMRFSRMVRTAMGKGGEG